jgi:hypothetical protein
MQQFLYWRMQVLLLRGDHQKVIEEWEVVRAASEQQAVDRRWELLLNHCRAMLLASRSTVGI